MVADWTGDNSGPAGTEGALEELRKQYPGANVHSSTFSAFFDEANKPENKDQLPVVTAEMGDAWIYGVPSVGCIINTARPGLRSMGMGKGWPLGCGGGGGAKHAHAHRSPSPVLPRSINQPCHTHSGS